MKDLCDGERMSNQQEGTDKHLILSGFSPEESDKILCSDIKINGSKGRIRRKNRFERILKQVQKLLGATCREKLMAALNKRCVEKKKQQNSMPERKKSAQENGKEILF